MNLTERPSILGLTLDQLAEFFRCRGENPAKAGLVFEQIYRKGRLSWADMEAPGPRSRALLARSFSFDLPQLARRQENDTAVKYLFQLADGCRVESVVMKHAYGQSLCLSTQAGCAMGCAFCASGAKGKKRDLLPQEMVGQLLAARQDLGAPLRRLALMGVGEPLDNFDHVMTFIDIVTEIHGLDLGPRHLTLSTCGLPGGLERLAQRSRPTNLCVSLHAPNDELRSRLMPVNRVFSLEPLLAAAAAYADRTRQRVVFEYAMLQGVNDSDRCAEELARLLSPLPCSVNLIPYNPAAGPFLPSSHERILAFYDLLKKAGLSVTIRKEMGGGLAAACGQLRAENPGSDLA